MKKNSFKKEERLCSKRLINGLFGSGSSFVVYPFRVVFSVCDDDAVGGSPARVLISVSKRRFKRAVDRNRIKRLMREVYRQHKSDELYTFLEKQGVQMILALQYVGKEELPFSLLNDKIQKVFSRLRDELATMGVGENH